jgi:capsular polysaccharide biosynthesis protein
LSAPGATDSLDATVGPADVYRALWRHKWFVVIFTAALAAGAWALTAREQKIYEASTLVRVQQEVQDPGQALGALEAGQRLAMTYARIVETAAMRTRIRAALDGAVPYDEIDVSASAVSDLELVSIAARSPEPRTAQLVANAAPTALRHFIADTSTASDRVVTLQPAKLPTEPVSPNMKLTLVLAVLIGLVFNGALALLIEIFGDRVPAGEELERLTGRPILTQIPVIPAQRRRRRRSAAKNAVVVPDASKVRRG